MEKLDDKELTNIVETLIFITDTPLTVKKISEITQTSNGAVERVIAELKDRYAKTDSALEIICVAGGWQMSTKAEYARWIRKLYKDRLTTKLTAASLETLAIIAYRQPITRAEIEQVRGVDVIAPLETLIEKGLVKVTGRKETVGRPLLYGITERFLRQFGLNTTKDLPEFEYFDSREKPIEEQRELFTKPEGAEILTDEAAESEIPRNDEQPQKTEENITEEQPLGEGG